MRLVLLLATDLILILVRAFKETTYTCVGQPSEKDVENAARYYRSHFSDRVHREILGLVPKRNVVKSFFHNDVRLGLEKTVHRFKDEITKDTDSSRLVVSSRSSRSSDRTVVDEDLGEILRDVKAAKAELPDPVKIAEMKTAEL